MFINIMHKNQDLFAQIRRIRRVLHFKKVL